MTQLFLPLNIYVGETDQDPIKMFFPMEKDICTEILAKFGDVLMEVCEAHNSPALVEMDDEVVDLLTGKPYDMIDPEELADEYADEVLQEIPDAVLLALSALGIDLDDTPAEKEYLVGENAYEELEELECVDSEEDFWEEWDALIDDLATE